MATVKKAACLIGLALVSGALLPASALAQAEVTHKVSGKVTGTSCTNVSTGDFTNLSIGRGNDIGKFTRYAEGHGEFTGPESYGGTGSFKAITANGDQLIGTFTFYATGDLFSSEHGDVLEATFTGGTGRFLGVSGTVTETDALQEVSSGTFACATTTGTYSGEITY